GEDSLEHFMTVTGREVSEENEIYTSNVSSHLLPAPPQFPLEVFPSKYREVVKQAANAFAVPVEIPACTLLNLAGACIGRARGIRAKEGWVEYPNLWLVLVARSGIGKSPCTKALLNSIFRIEHQTFQQYQKDIEDYNSAIEASQKSSGNKDINQVPDKPVFRQVYVDDATLESLQDAFLANPKGILWYRDEVSGLLQDFDKYSASGRKGGTKSRLNTAYDSGQWKINRKTSGDLLIPHACLSIFGTIQGGILSKLFSDLDKATGFLPRFLFVRVESFKPPFWSEDTFDDSNEKILADLTRKLLDMEFDQEGKPRLIEINGDAKKEYIEWHDRLAAEPWTNIDGGVYEEFSAKLRGQCLRLCLILHILESVAAERIETIPVNVETMRRAIILANCFKEHQRQVWQLLGKACQVTEASPIEKRVAAAIVSLEGEVNHGMLSTASITERINEGANEGFKVSKDSVGKSYKALGLHPRHLPDKSGRGVPITPEKMRELTALVQKDVRGVPSVPKQEMTGNCRPDTSAESCPTCPVYTENQRTPRTPSEEDVQAGDTQQTTVSDTLDGSDILKREEKKEKRKTSNNIAERESEVEWIKVSKAIEMIPDDKIREKVMKCYLGDNLEELGLEKKIDPVTREVLLRLDTLPLSMAVH
ncbi:DUF3987 domain-containing protein, partial [Gemmatimonadota bacterium]